MNGGWLRRSSKQRLHPSFNGRDVLMMFVLWGVKGVVTETTRSPVSDSPDRAQVAVLLVKLAVSLLPAMGWLCRLQGAGHSGSWDSCTGRGRAERKGQKVRDAVATVKNPSNLWSTPLLASSNAGQSIANAAPPHPRLSLRRGVAYTSVPLSACCPCLDTHKYCWF